MTLSLLYYHLISSVMPTFIDNNDEDKLNLMLTYLADIYVTFTK